MSDFCLVNDQLAGSGNTVHHHEAMIVARQLTSLPPASRFTADM
jgi:hypothetical protein